MRRVGIGDWPRLTRFYGISPLELQHLPHLLVQVYAEALPELMAEEQLAAITAADMPYQDKEQRRRVFARIERLLAPEPEPVDVTNLEGQERLAALGLRVSVAPGVES